MRIVIVAADIKHLEFLLNQIDLNYVIIEKIFLPEGPFLKEFVINYGTHTFKGCAIEMMTEELLEIEYDYILVTGSENSVIDRLKHIGISKEKIINTIMWSQPMLLEKSRLIYSAESDDNFKQSKVLITGLSYAYFGTELSAYTLPAINAAGISQDIYYDKLMAQRLVSIGGGIRVCGNRIVTLQFSCRFDKRRRIMAYNDICSRFGRCA